MTRHNIWLAVQWIFLTVFSYGLGWILPLIPLMFICMSCSPEQLGVIVGPIIGVSMSYFQNKLIKKRLHNGNAWFKASIVGWILLLAFFYGQDILFFTVESEWPYQSNGVLGEWYRNNASTIPILVTGIIVIGIVLLSWHQWRRVFKEYGARPEPWVIMSALGMYIGLVVRYLTYKELYDVIAFLLDLVTIALIYAMFTAGALIYLFRDVPPMAVEPSEQTL